MHLVTISHTVGISVSLSIFLKRLLAFMPNTANFKLNSNPVTQSFTV